MALLHLTRLFPTRKEAGHARLCVPEVTNWVIEDRCQFLLASVQFEGKALTVVITPGRRAATIREWRLIERIR